MGFNNVGAETVAMRLARLRDRDVVSVPLGVNVGKSRTAPLEEARTDYERSLRAVWPYADYVVLNVSSPNTPGLRALQESAALDDLLEAVAAIRRELSPRPVLLKIAPDIDTSQLDGIIDASHRWAIDGLVATNTTTSRAGLTSEPDEPGGLSGRPLAARSLELLRDIRVRTPLPVVSVGGVASAADVLQRLRHGASLVQLYTSFVYAGPQLPGLVCRDLLAACDRAGVGHLEELVTSDFPAFG
jgi:dihydroorotate dehydrogenase